MNSINPNSAALRHLPSSISTSNPTIPTSLTPKTPPISTENVLKHRYRLSQLKSEMTFTMWLENAIKAAPSLSKNMCLEQLIAIIKTEIKLIETPDDHQILDNLLVDLNLLQSTSPLIFTLKTAPGNQIIQTLFEDAKAHKNDKQLLLQDLINSRYRPYPDIICKSFDNLLQIFETKSPEEISLIFPHDQFSTFLNCLLPFCYTQYASPSKPAAETAFYNRLQAFFSTTTEPSVMLELLKSHMLHLLDHKEKEVGEYRSELFAYCQRNSKDRIAGADPKVLHDLEKCLILESTIMEELAGKLEAAIENYPKVVKLLCLKYRNAVCTNIKNNKVYLYPIDKKTWESLKTGSIIKKCQLIKLSLETELTSSLKEKGHTHFIYIDRFDKEAAKKIAALKKTAKASSLNQACESLLSCLQLMDVIEPGILYNNFFNWIEGHFMKNALLSQMARLTPFLTSLVCAYNEQIEYPLSDPSKDLSIPYFFDACFQLKLGILISNWTRYREDQQTFLSDIQQEPLTSPKNYVPATLPPAKKSKKILQPKPVENKEPELRAPAAPKAKSSPLKKLATAVQNTKKTVRQMSCPKQPIINPGSIETLQRHLSRSTSNIPSSDIKRVEALPGKEPPFQTLSRVSRWEQQTVKFLDPFSPELEQELFQYIFHIPHPLVDRFVHLGIKGERDGSECITIPAEVTINDMTFEGSIGYTFTSGNVCFHRHFTKNTLEKQKKKAVSYLNFPEVSHAYAKPLSSVHVHQYKCWIKEDEAGNATLQHKQTAFYAEEKREYAVSIKLHNAAY